MSHGVLIIANQPKILSVMAYQPNEQVKMKKIIIIYTLSPRVITYFFHLRNL